MATQQLDRRQKTAPWFGRAGLVLAGTICGIAAFVVDTGILWQHSTGCAPGPADPDEVFAGRLWMGVVLVAVIGVWALAWVGLPRHRAAVAVSALLGVGPALCYAAYGLDPASWVGGFCIPF